MKLYVLNAKVKVFVKCQPVIVYVRVSNKKLLFVWWGSNSPKVLFTTVMCLQVASTDRCKMSFFRAGIVDIRRGIE
ncbi:MAG TPA: hypothetical protein VFG32_04155 [Bacteroidota bacterium]|nr:hypothetical protein [Bacteroidota bacterium]